MDKNLAGIRCQKYSNVSPAILAQELGILILSGGHIRGFGWMDIKLARVEKQS